MPASQSHRASTPDVQTACQKPRFALLDTPFEAAVDSAGGQHLLRRWLRLPGHHHDMRTDTKAMDLNNARIAYRLAPMGADGDGRSVPRSS
jgi:hypothetical protein